jgi:flagellar assembly protein FliH
MILRDVIVTDELRPLVRETSRPSRPQEVVQIDTPAHEPDRRSVHDAPRVVEPVLNVEMVTAWLRAQVPEARRACATVLVEELQSLRDQAKSEGLRVGKAEAAEAARKELDARLAVLKRVVTEADIRLNQESDALAGSCSEIVAEALTKIAGPLLGTREAAVGAVEQVLKRVKEARELTIRVNAADVPVLEEAEQTLAPALAGRKFNLVADSRVDVGGCIVESRLGSLDGRFEAQLRELFEALRAAKAGMGEYRE